MLPWPAQQWFRLRWRWWWRFWLLRGDATSVRPKAQSPNGCGERRDERPGARGEARWQRGETDSETQIQTDREMEGDGDGADRVWGRGEMEEGEKGSCKEDRMGKSRWAGDIPSIFFYVPSRVIAHFLSRGLKAIQVSVCCCQSKRAELPLKSMLMQNVVEKASPNDICCCVIYWWSLWRIHYFSNSRKMKMSEVGLLLVNYLNGSCLSCLCSFIMNV